MRKRIVRLAALAAAAVAVTALGGSKANAETVLDLTNGPFPDSGTIGVAKYETNQVQPTGSGVIHSFVRIQTNQSVEQGYNTDGRPLQFDENNSGTFTHSLPLADLATVTKGGVEYYGFLLDINQNNNGTNALLNVNEIEVYLGDAGNLLGFTPGTGFGGGHSTAVYDIDSGSDNGILLDYNLNSGSGSGDMWMFIPKSEFNKAPKYKYVYLYSKFGVPNANNDGYEEWAALVGPTSSVVPLPASLWGGLTLLGAIGAAKLRSRRKSA